MQESSAVGEFIEETWGILDSLSAACAAGKTPGVFKEGLKTIERNLHTIKGNAAAFGFEDLSDAASRALDWLRAALRVTGNAIEKPADVPPVVEFTTKLRQYLALLNPGAAPPKGFWSEPVAPASQSIANVPKTSPAGQRVASTPRPGAEPDWDEEAKRILAQAPLVTPQIDSIVWMAIQKLTGHSPPAAAGQIADQGSLKPASSPASPKPEIAGAGRAERKVNASEPTGQPGATCTASAGVQPPAGFVTLAALTVHPYALEAVVKAAWLRKLQEKCHSNVWLEAAFSEVSDVLASFARWSVETRSVPLSSFFTEALAPVRRKSSLPRSKPAFDLTGCEILVLPAVGKLIRVLLDEALGATLPSASQGAETPLALKVTAARASGFIKVSVAGLGGLERSTARLHLDLLRQRVERCGVAMTRSADVAGESGVSISVPDCLDGMETLIVQAADERIGLPAHRVQAVLDLGDSDHPSKCDGCWLEVDGERLQLLDLAAEPAASPPRGVVVVVRTDKGKKALKVDAVLRRQEMIVTAPEHDTVPGEDFSLCLALDGLEWMPFLWCSSRLFERQESLVSRL